MKLIWQCVYSPRLYKIYKEGAPDTMYNPQGPEKWGDKVITTANTILNITMYTSPFICMHIYKRGFFSIDEAKTLSRFFGGVGCLLAIALLLRAYGRSTNTKYIQFLKDLSNSADNKRAYLNGIRKYDFEFQSWPATFSISSKAKSSWADMNPFAKCGNTNLPFYQRITLQILAFFATHTFGLRLIYPGSLAIVQIMLKKPLLDGRTQLVEEYDGQRAKLITADKNAIDTMFVDKRKLSPQGRTLVICSEGNSGFYEIGIMTTPIKAGYSTLGWNHPGFAASTGRPYPSQEHNAIDAVMQYAIEELEFDPEDIVVYGWSIGGYSATWAACNYPVKALVLDATFDDLLALAENQMPSSWSLLVKEVVRAHVDLNVGQLIGNYNGLVKLVRRTEDEIICLRPGQLSSNRGNHLLVKLIQHRHSDALDTPQALKTLVRLSGMPAHQRATFDTNEIEPYAKTLLPLIAKYMMDYSSTHCTPLPEEQFMEIMESFI